MWPDGGRAAPAACRLPPRVLRPPVPTPKDDAEPDRFRGAGQLLRGVGPFIKIFYSTQTPPHHHLRKTAMLAPVKGGGGRSALSSPRRPPDRTAPLCIGEDDARRDRMMTPRGEKGGKRGSGATRPTVRRAEGGSACWCPAFPVFGVMQSTWGSKSFYRSTSGPRQLGVEVVGIAAQRWGRAGPSGTGLWAAPLSVAVVGLGDCPCLCSAVASRLLGGAPAAPSAVNAGQSLQGIYFLVDRTGESQNEDKMKMDSVWKLTSQARLSLPSRQVHTLDAAAMSCAGIAWIPTEGARNMPERKGRSRRRSTTEAAVPNLTRPGPAPHRLRCSAADAGGEGGTQCAAYTATSHGRQER
eukprot:gene10176-biopygen12346